MSGRRRLLISALLLVLAGAGVARAQPSPPPPEPAEPERPFGAGAINLGLAMGLSTGSGTSFSVGGSFGYFVLAGLEPGLQLDVTFGSDRPTVTALLPYLRWVFWRSYSISPYIKAQGGRLFIADGFKDLTALGGGGGLVLFLNRRIGLQLEAVAFRYLPSDACGDNCTDVSFGLTFGIYLGGSRRAAGSRVAPPPPPPSPERTEPPRPSLAPPASPPPPAPSPSDPPSDEGPDRDEPYPG